MRQESDQVHTMIEISPVISPFLRGMRCHGYHDTATMVLASFADALCVPCSLAPPSPPTFHSVALCGEGGMTDTKNVCEGVYDGSTIQINSRGVLRRGGNKLFALVN